MDELIIYTSVASLVSFVGGLIFKSYFTEKGKNLATKQDIAEITQKIEDVKYTFTTGTEKLKANLTLSNNLKIEEVKTIFTTETEKLKASLLLSNNIQFGLFNEERNAIVDFNEKFFSWLHILQDSSLNGSDIWNYDELTKYKQYLLITRNSLDISNIKTSLFIKDETIRDSISELFNYSLPLLHLNYDILTKLRWNTLKLKSQPNQEHGNIISNQESIYSEYINKIKNEYINILPKCVSFQNNCREYLYKILTHKE